jgi:pantothenate kinase
MPPAGASYDELLARARSLAEPGGRRILGITGAPGAGKSTLAAQLAAALGPAAVIVPMDGYHLAHRELERLGLADRKGAPETFDGAGFVALLRRLRDGGEAVVYAPEFRREIEEPIAGAIAVPPDVPLVITEGNYLLLDAEPWAAVAGLLDETWFVDPPEAARLAWLTERHARHGKDPEAAYRWARGPDQANAELVAQTRPRADRVFAPSVVGQGGPDGPRFSW